MNSWFFNHKMISIYFLFLLLFSSCKSEFEKEYSLLKGSHIAFPNTLSMTFEGKDTIVNELFNSQYKLVVYKDSMSCTPCYIETLSKWNRILNKYNKDVLAVFFILSPSEEEEEDFRLLLRYSDFKYPVLIDNEQMFLKLNKQIPNNKKLHTFLLNSNNDVIFIGNPLENGRIEDLFEKQIQ